jgi:hypothetical protein
MNDEQQQQKGVWAVGTWKEGNKQTSVVEWGIVTCALLIISKMHLLTNWCNELITRYKRLMILKLNSKIIFQKVAAFDHD